MQGIKDAQAWLDDYQRRLADIAARARGAQERLAAVDATRTSPDGAVTATVTPGGELRALVLHEAAQRLSRIQLADAITGTVAAARAEASRAAAEVVEPMLGRRGAGFTAGNGR